MEHVPGLLPTLATFILPAQKKMEENGEGMFGCLVVLYGFVVPASKHVPATVKKAGLFRRVIRLGYGYTPISR